MRRSRLFILGIAILAISAGLLASCDLLFGIQNFTVKIVNHTGTSVNVWWSDMTEAQAKAVPANSTSAVYSVRTSFRPLDFKFYSKVSGAATREYSYVVGDGWDYTLGFYSTGSYGYLIMDDEVR